LYRSRSVLGFILILIVCCAYQCLRMTNFVSQPTIDAIKTLLIIGNVLSYNMNPGISYVLLGMDDSFHYPTGNCEG
jgi:hypothetical protein